MMTGPVTILGVGNPYHHDDGAGVAALLRLRDGWDFPDNVELYDGGVSGPVGLLPIIEEAGALIVLDSVRDGHDPGTVTRYTVDDFKLAVPAKMSAHDMGLLELLAIAELNGHLPADIVIIGVTPQEYTAMGEGLTPKVAAAVEKMIELALAECARLGVVPQLSGERAGGSRIS